GGRPVTDATIYVGRYEARVTPVADTSAKTSLPSAIRMAPGSYQFVIRAPGHGLHRLTLKVRAGQTTGADVFVHTNWASLVEGASVNGNNAKACAKSSAPPECGLVDDTENTDWTAATTSDVNVAKPTA